MLFQFFILNACAGPEEAGERPEAEVAAGEQPEAPPAPLSPAELRPSIREVGGERSVPTRVVVRFARPVVDEAEVGESAGEGTVLRIEPPLEGSLRFTGTTVLTFTPEKGFRPATDYRVELLSVETSRGRLEAPEPGRWAHVFRTPGFDFVRASLDRQDLDRRLASVDLTFSAAVEADAVARFVRFTVVEPGGARRSPRARLAAGEEPNVVRALLTGDAVRAGSRLEVVLEEGAPSAADPGLKAGAARASLAFEAGPPVEIRTAYRHEAASGFFVQVICDDAAVGTRTGYWDDVRQEYFELSARCQPGEIEALDRIRFEPPVEASIAPSRGGFRIFGDFERGPYELRIDAGLRTVDGGLLPKAFETTFEVGPRSPQVRFVSKGRYLPRDAWRSLPVEHLNVERATLTVRHVPPENLVFWMSADEHEAADERNSNLLLSRELAFGGGSDEKAITYVDLGSMIPADTRGLLELTLAGGGARDVARLVLTDLHLVAKRAGRRPGERWSPEIEVWALDMESLAGVRGVEVQAVRKSGFVMATCRTGGRGGCRLSPPADGPDPSPPFALVARRGEELTYLRFQDLEAEVQEERIAGEPYHGEQPYRAAVYGERGVYRPGETAHFAAIVRAADNRAPETGMPVVAKLVDPRGRTLRRTTLSTNAAGYVHLDQAFAAFATTGRYELRLEAGERKIGQHRFQVEEFVPERLEVAARSVESEHLLGEPMEVAVDARYLFGAVPAGHQVELACDLEPASFEPPRNAQYHYGVWRPEDSPEKPLSLGTAAGQLDAEGRAVIACAGGGRAGGFRGPARLVARAAVFEAGSGRTTVGQATAPVHPERFYLGLQSGTSKLEAGDELSVEGVVVDWRGETITAGDRGAVAEVEVQFLRLEAEYGWYFDESLGHETYRRYLRPVVEERRTVAVEDGRFRTAWTPESDAPAFVVRASAGDARTDLEIEGRGEWYYWAPEESHLDRTPKPGRPAWLALDTPESVTVDEPFAVRYQAPFEGRLLLTVETDRLLRSEWVDVGPGEGVWMSELESFEPNVYVTAFLIKNPRAGAPGGFLPERAFGVRSVRVEPVEFTQELELQVPGEVRSGSRLAVELDLGRLDGATWATVAAVDEGILSLTGFESPDPFAAIFARRALGVETFETVGWTLMVPPPGPGSVVGGDGTGSLGRVDVVKPVALWSGLVEVPADGRLEVAFDVPQYRGALRVMAVTAGPVKMGHADARVTVRDPLVVQSTLPRFLTGGDELRIPVSLTNLSGREREVAVRLEAESLPLPGLPAGQAPPAAVEVVGARERSLTLADGASGVVVFRARALRPTGAARMTVTARSGELESIESSDVPLLPAGPKSRRVERLELAAGELDLTPYLEGWLPLSERSTFWVTANPYGQAFSHLEHLVRYPYGCLEQTTSSTRPLLYLAGLIESVDPELLAQGGIEDMVARGLERILGMQTADGGFAYWPGGGQPAYWATAYATHLLLDAQKLRYPVPQEAIDEALSWMERQVSNHYAAGRDDWYSKDAEPYMHFVLAMAGRARKGRMETLLAQLGDPSDSEQKEMVFMLRAGLHVAGDHRYESRLKSPDLGAGSERRNGWSFYSDRRRRGFMLATLVDLFGRDPAFEPLAARVAEGLRGERSGWYTTQELVWGITGLGKMVEAGARGFEPPVLVADGRTIAPEPQPAGARGGDRTWSLARASEYRSLTLRVPEKGPGKLYLVLSSEGVRRDPDWTTGGEGLRLARRYLDERGQPRALEGAGHRLGDLVYVELEVSNLTGERVANVALVDRIPAGWEIENPRLGRGGALDWIDEGSLWRADHLDVRDDRLEVFGHLEKGESRKVVYAARAVTAGEFALPPAEAEAMYQPSVWAREGEGRVSITGPWGE